MNRILWLMLALVLVVPVSAGTASGAELATPTTEAPPTTDAPPTTEPPSTRPPISANEFFPEERDVTSCIGVLERPGCGSENRGGWRQTLILAAMFGGLLVIFGNVARGVRKNRSEDARHDA